MGTVATFSFYFVFNAYSIASPSVVSLYEYSLIIWSILTGFILFDSIPTLRTFIGVAIIIGAGVYIYIREKAKDQTIVTDNPLRQNNIFYKFLAVFTTSSKNCFLFLSLTKGTAKYLL